MLVKLWFFHSADKTASLVFFPVAQQRGLISYQGKWNSEYFPVLAITLNRFVLSLIFSVHATYALEILEEEKKDAD